MTRSSEEIEREAEATRQRLTETAETLRDKMSPGQIIDEMTSYFRFSNGSQMVSNLGAQVRDNPLPLALIGAGLAWLALGGGPRSRDIDGYARHSYRRLAEGTGHDNDDGGRGTYPVDDGQHYGRAAYGASGTYPAGQSTYGRPGAAPRGPTHHATSSTHDSETRKAGTMTNKASESLGKAGRSASDMASSAGSKASSTLSQASERVSEQASRAGSAVSEAAATAGHAAANAGSAIGDTAGVARDSVASAGRYVAETSARAGRRAQRTFTEVLNDEPLIIGAAGIAVGIAVGAMLPRTRYEDEYVGPYRDQVRESIGEAARDGVDQAKEVAADAYEAGKEEARKQDLLDTSGKPVAEKASKVARTAADTAESEVRKKAGTG